MNMRYHQLIVNSALLLSLTACFNPVGNEEANAGWHSVDRSQLPDGILAKVESADAKVSLSLVRIPKGDRPVYELSIAGQPVLKVPCSHYTDGIKEISISSGSGIVVHVRKDGQALVIEEWVGGAVSETDPIFLSWESGSPEILTYPVVDFTPKEKLRTEGVGSREVFLGWKKSGVPEIKATLDD